MRVVKNKSVTMETNKEDPSKVPNEPKPAADAAKPLIIDFDGTWKAIIAEFFEDFMAFFLPDIHRQIDYAASFEFLEQELYHIMETFGYTKRITDKLVKVHLKTGELSWILLHLEVQSYFETDFNKRMFLLYSWIYGKFDQKIAALAIYTGSPVPVQFHYFEQELFGTKLRYDFNTYRVMQQDEAALKASDNIFALFVLANKYVNQTRDEAKYPERLRLKEQIFELALAKKIDLEKTWRFLIFVQKIMLLPNDLTDLFNQYVKSKINQVMSELNTFSLNDSYETFACIFTEVLHGEDYHKMIAKAQAEAAEKMRLEMDLLLAQERSNAEKARQEAAKLLMQERLTVEKTEKALQKERLAAEKAEKTLQKERLAAKKAEKERLEAEKALQQERLDAEKALQQERLEAEKALQQERLAMILRFYQKKWSIEQIAEMMELDPLFIKQVVEHHP
jgi:hypothetical protein